LRRATRWRPSSPSQVVRSAQKLMDCFRRGQMRTRLEQRARWSGEFSREATKSDNCSLPGGVCYCKTCNAMVSPGTGHASQRAGPRQGYDALDAAEGQPCVKESMGGGNHCQRTPCHALPVQPVSFSSNSVRGIDQGLDHPCLTVSTEQQLRPRRNPRPRPDSVLAATRQP